MDPTIHVKIDEALKCLVHDDISLSDFEIWFGPVLWSVESSSDSTAIVLAYEIAGQLAEYEHGHRTSAELLVNLAGLARHG
jgi:hypothetical protein